MRLSLPSRRSSRQSSRQAAAAEPAIGEIVQGFESLGDNCEFGLVQRYAGAEPLGLLRFNDSADLGLLVEAVDSGFAEYGAAGDLEILEAGGHFVCRSRRYGLPYRVSDAPPSATAASLLPRETRRVAYLKRRLLEDFAAGEKIVVRKSEPDERAQDVAALVRAVRRHGPAVVLNVRAAGEGGEPGRVRWGGEGVLEGVVRRFAPRETAYLIDLEPWLDLCRAADRLVRGTLEPAVRGRPRNLLARPSRMLPGMVPNILPSLLPSILPRAAEHVLGRGRRTAADTEVFGLRQPTGGLDADAVHAFSAWVWVPSTFRGTRIGAAVGSARLGWRDADLAVRDAWQRVWIGAKPPRTPRGAVTVGLVVEGPAGDRFWSADWRLERAPTPSPGPPPRDRRR